MALVIRKTGSRRSDTPVVFPVEDSQRTFVIQDRRQLADRRKAEYDLDDMKVIFAKMAEN